jgi:hypothetical protein
MEDMLRDLLFTLPAIMSAWPLRQRCSIACLAF